jgi:hypothetical protein
MAAMLHSDLILELMMLRLRAAMRRHTDDRLRLLNVACARRPAGRADRLQ